MTDDTPIAVSVKALEQLIRCTATPIIDELAERFSESEGTVDDYVDYMNRIPDAILSALSTVKAPAEVLERLRGEDWENACHELFWETGNIEQFELIQRRAEENANERPTLTLMRTDGEAREAAIRSALREWAGIFDNYDAEDGDRRGIRHALYEAEQALRALLKEGE